MTDEREPDVSGRYAVAFAEPVGYVGERANFGVVLWGDDAPVRVAVLPDDGWPRFEAFTGFDRAGCEDWLREWTTPDGLAAYLRHQERGSIGQAMSTYKLTDPLPCALNARDEDPLDGLVDAFLRGRKE